VSVWTGSNRFAFGPAGVHSCRSMPDHTSRNTRHLARMLNSRHQNRHSGEPRFGCSMPAPAYGSDSTIRRHDEKSRRRYYRTDADKSTSPAMSFSCAAHPSRSAAHGRHRLSPYGPASALLPSPCRLRQQNPRQSCRLSLLLFWLYFFFFSFCHPILDLLCHATALLFFPLP